MSPTSSSPDANAVAGRYGSVPSVAINEQPHAPSVAAGGVDDARGMDDACEHHRSLSRSGWLGEDRAGPTVKTLAWVISPRPVAGPVSRGLGGGSGLSSRPPLV